MNQPSKKPNDPNLRDRNDLDPENISDPVSFVRDYNEAGRLIEEEDIDRTEQIEPKSADKDDVKGR